MDLLATSTETPLQQNIREPVADRQKVGEFESGKSGLLVPSAWLSDRPALKHFYAFQTNF
jgi:hypothetical protein